MTAMPVIVKRATARVAPTMTTMPASRDLSVSLRTHSPFCYRAVCRQIFHFASHPARAGMPRSSDYTPPLTGCRCHTSAQAHPELRPAARPSQDHAIVAAYFFRRFQVLVRSLSLTPGHYSHASTYPLLTTLYFDAHVDAINRVPTHSPRYDALLRLCRCSL